MANIKHLHEIKGRQVVRINVPKPLRGIVFAGGPGSELREWIGTDRKAAERAAPEVIARFYRRIDEAKALLDAATPTLGTAAKHHYAAELRLDDVERALPNVATLTSLRSASTPTLVSKLRGYLVGAIEDGEAEALVGYAVNDAIAAGAADANLDRRDLLRAMAEAHLDVIAAHQERDTGAARVTPPISPLLQPEAPPESVQVTSRPAAVQSGEMHTGQTVNLWPLDIADYSPDELAQKAEWEAHIDRHRKASVAFLVSIGEVKTDDPETLELVAALQSGHGILLGEAA